MSNLLSFISLYLSDIFHGNGISFYDLNVIYYITYSWSRIFFLLLFIRETK